jgi:hypothetical protein
MHILHSVFGVCCLLATSVPAASQPVAIPHPPSVAGLGTGELTLQLSTQKPRLVTVTIGNSLADVGAIVLDTEDGELLAAVTATAGPKLITQIFGAATPRAASHLDTPDLEGIEMKLAFAFDTRKSNALRITVLRNDGVAYPMPVRTSSPDTFKLTFSFRAGPCYTITGFCGASPPCPSCIPAPKECCTRGGGCLFCGVTCSLECSPCTPSGPACQ